MKQEATTRWIWGGLAVVALALLGGFGAGVDSAPASVAAMGVPLAVFSQRLVN